MVNRFGVAVTESLSEDKTEDNECYREQEQQTVQNNDVEKCYHLDKTHELKEDVVYYESRK